MRNALTCAASAGLVSASALDTPPYSPEDALTPAHNHDHGHRGWLRSLGLEQYEAAFHANAVDADVLRDLTDQDLEKLGVLLGHRRKLLRAIAALDGALAPASAPRPTPLPIEAILAVAAPTDPSQRAVAKFDDVALLVFLDELVKRTARPERPGCGSRAKDEA